MPLTEVLPLKSEPVKASLIAGYVAAGTYTDIISITAPDKAVPGSRVDITVRIKNTYSAAIGIMVGGALEYGVSPWPTITFSDNVANVGAGQTYSFYGYFYMPEADVTVHAYSYFYGADGYWYFDDEATKRVLVGGWQFLDSAQITVRSVVAGWQLLDVDYATIGTFMPGWQLLDVDYVTIGTFLPGWQLLDVDYVTIGTFLPGWQVLDTESVTVGLAASLWQLLHTRTITVTLAPPVVGWELLDTESTQITIAPPAVGWELLDEKTASLTAGPPEEVWELISHKLYDRADTYNGKAEVCTFEFKLTPEQIPGTEWFGEMIANAFADEVIKQDSEMLELEVYEDTTPALWTNFRVVATATIPEGEGVTNPLPWAIIIVAVLAILFVVAITFLIREIKTIDWTNPVQAIPTALLIGGVVVLAGVGIAMAVGKKAPEKSSARA